MEQSIIIVGGGLAGLTAAIHLSRAGFDVTVVEKHHYPRHKVCGEYISNEVRPYLEWLDLDISSIGATSINRTELSTVDGKLITGTLPLGGFGISRYALDNYLYQEALNIGCAFIFDSVIQILHSSDKFTITLAAGKSLTARVVLGGFGKRSNIDQIMNRRFFNRKSNWLAVKAHYEVDFPNDVVALHNFNGGYCGISKVENNLVNICYLADYLSFKQHKNILEYQKQVLYRNSYLKDILERSKPVSEKPLTISQLSFDPKSPVEDHVLMIGDSAGLIHPLCGNGMAIAIHSAKIASELIISYLQNKISRAEMEQNYILKWNTEFSRRMRTGRMLAAAFRNKTLSSAMIGTLAAFPQILPAIIKSTHGKPLQVEL